MTTPTGESVSELGRELAPVCGGEECLNRRLPLGETLP